jgi:hypothetical protein
MSVQTPTRNFQVIRQFTAGKSKDIVLQALLNGEKVIVKLSKNIKSLSHEAHSTKNISKLYNDFDYNPIVQVLVSGKQAEYKGNTYAYYAMEDLSDEYETLHDVIRRNCLLKKWVDDIPTIFKNLFEVLMVLKLNMMSHCDLHTENIFVHRVTKTIKIIDWNMTSRICKKKRQLTAVILKEYIYCKNARTLFQLKNFMKQILSKKGIDSDVFMFVKILGLFYYNEGQFQALKSSPRIVYEALDMQNKQVIVNTLSAFRFILHSILDSKI